MTASSFIPVSLDPPLVAICIQQTSTSWPRLRKLDRIGLSVLAQGQERECLSLSAKRADRFAAVDWTADADGAVFVHGAAVWLDCSQYGEFPAGDHVIALLRIHLARTDSSVAPLVFHASRFRRLAAGMTSLGIVELSSWLSS
jgi:flavin reductase (DIM6/NTAB) family NADH-FMN oxidoreductase RutF